MPLRAVALLAIAAVALGAQTTTTKPRARDLGISAMIGGTPGTLDAITDVAGVEVATRR